MVDDDDEDDVDDDVDDTDDGDEDGEDDRESPSSSASTDLYRSPPPVCTTLMTLDRADDGGHGCGSVRTTTSNVTLSGAWSVMPLSTDPAAGDCVGDVGCSRVAFFFGATTSDCCCCCTEGW